MNKIIKNISSVFFRLLFLYLIIPLNAFAQNTVGFSISNANVTVKDTFTITFRADSTLSGKNIYSFCFALSYSSSYLEFIALEPAGIILDSWGLPLCNIKSSGKLYIVGAGATPLSGSGDMFNLKFCAIGGGGLFANIQNITAESYLNEGFPPMSITGSRINIANRIYPNISPNGGSMMWGTTQLLTVTNAVPPLSFASSDTSIATIDDSGNLYAKNGGRVKVTVTDSHGASQTSNDFLIYHNRFSMANTEGVLDIDTRVPLNTTPLPPGSAVFSFEGNISFNPSHLEFIGLDPGGSGMMIESVPRSGSVRIVGASGSGIENGTICYLIFRIKNTLGLNQQTDLTISDFTANESGLYFTASGGKVKRVAQASYRPVAVAGSNFSVNEGDTVTLDGSASYDDDGDSLSYHWSSPAGIVLNDSTLVRPRFIAPLVDVNTDFIFSLIVNDGDSDSDPSYVTVTVLQVNMPPVADAGPDKSYLEGSMVTLDGSASYDPDGDPLSFQWTSLDGIVLFDPRSPAPSFVAPQVSKDTEYRFMLVVSDGVAFSPADTVTITVLHLNRRPVAYAGIDQTVNEGDLVYLDGSLSYDPDGDSITFLWSAPSNVVLSSPYVSNPYFTAPSVQHDSVITISLVVNDGLLDSEADHVLINIKNVGILSHEALINSVTLISADSVSIDQLSKEILLYMPYGSDISSLSPEFVISDKAGISPSSGTSRNFTSPQTYTVTAEDGITKSIYRVEVYVPVLTLSTMLYPGWNWLSLGVGLTDRNIANVFSGLSLSDRDYVKSATASSVYYTSSGWFGALVSLPEKELLLFKKASSQLLSLTGKEINPFHSLISVMAGWNRIAYLLKEDRPLDFAFDSSTLPSGDILLKGREGSAVFYPLSGWVGDLDSLKVLNGYMMKVVSGSNIRYSSAGDNHKSMHLPEKYFTRDQLFSMYQIRPYAYEFSCNLICDIVNDKDEYIAKKGDVLIAEINGVPCGVTEASYVGDLGRYVFFLSVFSNSLSEITLHLKSPDHFSNQSLVESFTFKADEVYGESFKPLRLHLAGLESQDQEVSLLTLYPNPVSTDLFIFTNEDLKRVSLYNSFGSCIRIETGFSGNHNFIDTRDLISGLYLIKIETDSGLIMKQFIKLSNP